MASRRAAHSAPSVLFGSPGILLLPILILLPSVTVVSGMPAFRLEYAIVFPALLLTYFRWAIHMHSQARGEGFGILLAATGVVTLASILHSFTFPQYTFSVNDTFMIVQLVLYYAIALFAAKMPRTDRNIQLLQRVLLVSGILVVTFCFLQYFDPLELNRRFLVPVFYQTTQWRLTNAVGLVLDDPARRVVGSFGNPNYCGMFLALLWAGVIAQYAFPVRRKLPNTIYVSLLLVVGIALELTGSRTGIVAAVGATAVALPFLGTPKRLKILASLAIASILVLFALMLGPGLPVVVARLFSETSAQKHLAISSTAVSSAWRSWLLGLGPWKSALGRVVDNEYALFFQKFGILGLSTLLLLHLWLVRKGLRGLLHGVGNAERYLGLLALQVGVVWAISGLTADVFKNPQLMGLFLFLAAVGGRLPRKTVVLKGCEDRSVK